MQPALFTKKMQPIDTVVHQETPLFSALKAYECKNTISFDVPGHKRGLDAMYELHYYGKQILRHDINSTPGLDNYDHPTSVIKAAQYLMADLYLADEAHFLVNGTTQGIQTMILSVCRPGDTLILPRNVHKSVLNAMALADVTPKYIAPTFDDKLGVSHNLSTEDVRRAIDAAPHARAVFVMNPTYFGAVSDLKAITEYAHQHNMPVLVDEAHGAHFRFSHQLPLSSMEAGADMAATSIHKQGGSFTQSSVLLVQGTLIDRHKVKSTINMLTSTSASYLLMSSLDIARKNLALNGPKNLDALITHIRSFRHSVNLIPGFYMHNKEQFEETFYQQLDETKLAIYIDHALPLSGFDVYHILRNEYDIQMELCEPHLVMGIVSIHDNNTCLAVLLRALTDISQRYYQESELVLPTIKQAIIPQQVMSLRDVLYADKRAVCIQDAVGEICAESLMIYPPGIPIVMAGELITQEIIDYWSYINDQPITKIGAENKNEVYIINRNEGLVL